MPKKITKKDEYRLRQIEHTFFKSLIQLATHDYIRPYVYHYEDGTICFAINMPAAYVHSERGGPAKGAMQALPNKRAEPVKAEPTLDESFDIAIDDL